MMYPERQESSICSGAKGIFFVAMVAYCCSSMLGCRSGSHAATPAANTAVKAEDPATRDLHAIADKATAAVMSKDLNTLLQYDQEPEDEASLKSTRGDLYCYLFDSSCIAGTNKRAIYDLFSTVPRLGIDASVTSVGGRNYGLLLFYDKSQVSEAELYSPGFLCSEKGLKDAVSWRFIQAGGKWTTSTLFEYKTESACKQ